MMEQQEAWDFYEGQCDIGVTVGPGVVARLPKLDADTPGLVRNDHPDTAKDAAATANTGRTRKWVYSLISERGWAGATDEEIINAGTVSGFSANGLRPRRVELVRDGVVIDSGRKRATQSGRQAIVWILDDGRNA